MGERWLTLMTLCPCFLSLSQRKLSCNTIHSNFHKSIRKARFGAFVDNNQGFVRYYLMALLCVMFGSFRFPKHLREYIDNDNTRLVNNLRRLDYLIEAMKERQYEDAWNEIDGLTVLYIIAQGFAKEELADLQKMLQYRITFKAIIKLLRSYNSI